MKAKYILIVLFLFGVGGAAVYHFYSKDKMLTSSEITALEEKIAKLNADDASQSIDQTDIPEAGEIDLELTELEQAESSVSAVEIIEVETPELQQIKLHQAKVELPEIKQLKEGVLEETMSLEYEAPGSAESVIVDSNNISIPVQTQRTLKVDPQVIQSVEQQTGIPSSEIEQAFTQD